jgi:hypothetical protein
VTLFLLINVALYIWVSWTFFYSKNSNGTYPNIMFMTAKANGIFGLFWFGLAKYDNVDQWFSTPKLRIMLKFMSLSTL